MDIYITLKRARTLINADGADKGEVNLLKVPKGRYICEQVPHPTRADGEPWYVLKGTLIGQSIRAWWQWTKRAPDDDRGVIIEGVQEPPKRLLVF